MNSPILFVLLLLLFLVLVLVRDGTCFHPLTAAAATAESSKTYSPRPAYPSDGGRPSDSWRIKRMRKRRRWDGRSRRRTSSYRVPDDFHRDDDDDDEGGILPVFMSSSGSSGGGSSSPAAFSEDEVERRILSAMGPVYSRWSDEGDDGGGDGSDRIGAEYDEWDEDSRSVDRASSDAPARTAMAKEDSAASGLGGGRERKPKMKKKKKKRRRRKKSPTSPPPLPSSPQPESESESAPESTPSTSRARAFDSSSSSLSMQSSLRREEEGLTSELVEAAAAAAVGPVDRRGPMQTAYADEGFAKLPLSAATAASSAAKTPAAFTAGTTGDGEMCPRTDRSPGCSMGGTVKANDGGGGRRVGSARRVTMAAMATATGDHPSSPRIDVAASRPPFSVVSGGGGNSAPTLTAARRAPPAASDRIAAASSPPLLRVQRETQRQQPSRQPVAHFATEGGAASSSLERRWEADSFPPPSSPASVTAAVRSSVVAADGRAAIPLSETPPTFARSASADTSTPESADAGAAASAAGQSDALTRAALVGGAALPRDRSVLPRPLFGSTPSGGSSTASSLPSPPLRSARPAQQVRLPREGGSSAAAASVTTHPAASAARISGDRVAAATPMARLRPAATTAKEGDGAAIAAAAATPPRGAVARPTAVDQRPPPTVDDAGRAARPIRRAVRPADPTAAAAAARAATTGSETMVATASSPEGAVGAGVGTTATAPASSAVIAESARSAAALRSTTPWARRFLSSHPADALLPVPREFLGDGFNLVRLAPVVERAGFLAATASAGASAKVSATAAAAVGPPYHLYRAALRLILEEEEEVEAEQLDAANEEGNGDVDQSTAGGEARQRRAVAAAVRPEVQAAAELLYGLIHARYAASPRGLEAVRKMMRPAASVAVAVADAKLKVGAIPDMADDDAGAVRPVFGRCPRVGCCGMPLLPCGESDEHNDLLDIDAVVIGERGSRGMAMRYCCSCGETLNCWESEVDGSAWGATFPHLFLMAHGRDVFPMLTRSGDAACAVEAAGGSNFNVSPPALGGHRPVPHVFGFRVHPTAAKVRYPLLATSTQLQILRHGKLW